MSIGTDVRAAGNTAWRDFATDGILSTGENKTAKSEIRAFVGLVASGIDGLEASVVSLAAMLTAGGAAVYVASSASLPAGTTEMLGFVSAGAGAGLWVRDTEGDWSNTGLLLPASVIDRLTAAEAAIADETSARTAADDALRALAGGTLDLGRQCATRRRYVTGIEAYSMFSGPIYGPADYKTWMVGINPPREIKSPPAAIFRLSFSAQPVQIGVRVVRRLGSVGDGAVGSLIWPSAHVDDVTVQALTWHDAADVLSDPELYANLQSCVLPLAADIGIWTTDQIYFVQIYAIDASASYIGIGMQRGRNRNAGIDPLWKTGGFSPDVTPGAGGFTPSDGGMVAYVLAESVYEAGDGEVRTEADRSRVSMIDVADPYQTAESGGSWAVTLPVAAIDIQPEPLGRSSTDGTVSLGIAKPASGLVRYDVVALNTDTGQVLAASGTAREKDSVEYIPDNTGFSRLGYLRVDNERVEFIQTNHFRDYVRAGEEEALSRHLERNRALLPKTMLALRRGLPITLIVYTDSIHAISSGVTGDYYTPNGSNRDVIGYLEDYPADTLATITRYDGDGGAGAHVHIGAHWKIADAMERAGSPVQVLNLGIGGTTTGVGFTTDGAPNARNPTRLAALASLVSVSINPIVMMNFGMNDLGTSGIYADYLDLISVIRAAGGEVIISTCPRPGRRNGGWTQTDYWLYTTGQTIRAAQDGDCAYMDLSKLFGDGYLGSVGISKEDLCSANGSNHPGAYELNAIGEYCGLNFG